MLGKFLVRVCVNDLGICDAVTTFFAKKSGLMAVVASFGLEARCVPFAFCSLRGVIY